MPLPPHLTKDQLNEGTEDEFEKYMTEELATKEEFEVCVWADTHKQAIESLGMGKMCISHISDTGVKYEDMEFVDHITREKNIYQARVYTGTIRLTTSFFQFHKRFQF